MGKYDKERENLGLTSSNNGVSIYAEERKRLENPVVKKVAPKTTTPKTTVPKITPEAKKFNPSPWSKVQTEFNMSQPGIGNQIAKTLPAVKKQEIAQGTAKFFKEAPVQAGFMQGVSLNNPLKSLERKLDTKVKAPTDSLAYKAGNIGGTIAQFAVPYTGAAKGVGLLTKAALPKLGKIGSKVAASVATDLAVGLPLNINQAYNKDSLKGTDALKSIAMNTGIDLITGGVLETLGVVLKSGKKVANKIEFDKLPPIEKAEAMSQIEKLAYESNVRKGKITPNANTLFGGKQGLTPNVVPTLELPKPTTLRGPNAVIKPGIQSMPVTRLTRDLGKGREMPFSVSRGELPVKDMTPVNQVPKTVKPDLEVNVPEKAIAEKPIDINEKVIGIERGNQGRIAKVNPDGSYLIHFLNKQNGQEALVKMRREEFEPINQTIMDLKQKQIPKQQTPTVSHKLDELTKQDLTAKAPTIKDISGSFGQRNDIFETIEKTFGKDSIVKQKIINPFLKSKGDAARLEITKEKEAYDEVVKKLGIRKGSPESAAVQWYGEKVRVVKNLTDPQTGKKVENPTEVPYTLQMLKEDFPAKWENIVKADTFFRKNYDEMIDAINLKRAEVYPKAEENLLKISKRIEKVRAAEGRYASLDSGARLDLIKKLTLEQEHYMAGKIIPKRTDYYRHYKDMAEGFAALKNVFDTPSQIGSNLAGISQFTKPKSKWLSLAQQRGKGTYDADAVGGFLEYIPAASYAINIDPHIAKFRELADVLAEATDKSKNANNLIRTIREYSDHLAGKTNKWDRILEDMPGGRKGMSVLNWVNNRVKSNVILGNAGSALSQIANIPNGIAWIKDPESLSKGFYQTIKGITKETPINGSNFITERYKGNALQPFNDRLIGQPKKLAEWILGNADAVGTRFIWNSAYEKALKTGSKDAMQEADDVTRMLVAGRGIGEIPLNQQRNITKILAPFTLEVQNAWKVQRKMVENKDFGGLIVLYVLSYGFNKGMESVKGNGVLFDPIQAIYDAATEEDISLTQRVGRVAGEVISNIPYGSTLATLYPEYGIQFAEGVETPTRKELFGRTDPTRFGSGLVSQQAITDPIFKLLPSWGGNQLKKTYDNAKSMQLVPNLNPVSENFMKKQDTSAAIKDGKLRFPIDKTPENFIKGGLFGNYATTNGKAYIKNEGRPFSEKQTERFKGIGSDTEMFDFISKNRDLKTKADIINALRKSELTLDQQRALLTQFYEYKL